LAEAGKADGEFGGVARAFAAQDEAATVFGVADMCAGREAAGWGGRGGGGGRGMACLGAAFDERCLWL